MTAFTRLPAVIGCLLALGPLAACGEEKPKPAPIRPVLSVVIAPAKERVIGFTGTIKPRYEVGLGFRLLGRLISREVEVGDTVKAAQRLAAIDPLALDLAVRSSEADLFTARAQLANAKGIAERQAILLSQHTATQAEFDAARQGKDSAQAALVRAEAALVKAREQRGYAQIASDIDGVVTAVGAQVGQVVSPGQSIVTIARPDIREVMVDLPEDVARTLAPGALLDVSLQLDPTVKTTASVREISPQADAATRTRRILATLVDAQGTFRLGTTVLATLTRPPDPSIELPAEALFEREGRTAVWIVDPASRTVSLRDVKVAGRDGGRVRISEGLQPGTRVVTAGIHSLKPGQEVLIPDETRS